MNLMKIYGCTEDAIKQIAKNVTLISFPDLQVTKITKIKTAWFHTWGEEIKGNVEDVSEYHRSLQTIVSVRTMNCFKKAVTKKVYINKSEAQGNVARADFKNFTFEEALALEVLNNNFDSITKEQGLANYEMYKQDLENEKKEEKRQKEIKSVVDEVNYNISPRAISRGYSRSPKQLKTSFKKYSADVMAEAKTRLDEKGADLLQKVIVELALPIVEKGNPASLLATVTNCNVLAVCKELEVTFEEESAELFESALAWLKKQDELRGKELEKKGYIHYPRSEKHLEANALEIVEANKFKLFGCVIRNLGQYPIENVKRISFESYVQGFQGMWKMNLEDGTTKTFHARSIIAEGYHVCRHYRYIGTVTK